MEDRSLGAILLENTSLTQEQLDAGLALQKDKGIRLGEALVQLKYLRMEDILKAISIQVGIPYLNKIDPDEVQLELIGNLSINYAKRNEVIPLRKEGDVISVAVANPFDHCILDDLRLFYGTRIRPQIASSYEIISSINIAYNKVSEVGQDKMVGELETENLDSIGQELEEVQDLLESADEAPIIRLVNSLLFRAVKQKASDIHIEPFDKDMIVRFRIDGILYDIMHPPKKAQSAITSRVKVMADLNIAEKRLPQDGRIRIKIAGKDIDIRVSTIPTSHGESVVMRLLDKSQVIKDMASIGLASRIEEQMKELIHRSHGILLVTGPTGSGKTTTLYTALSQINSVDRKIITVEDPVEYQLSGINQIPVNPKIELSFATGLRAILRQDPDVVMVGEIRDHETAEIAIQAALTGHLVFSTLHTNDAASSITRLLDMGIEPFLVSSSVIGIMAQRLVRTVCRNCAQKYVPSEAELQQMKVTLEALKGRKIYKAVGCQTCVQTGYAGRTGIHELLLMNDNIRALIMQGVDASTIKRQVTQGGMKTLREDGVQKVLMGITTLEEIFRVTQDEVVTETVAA
ncbi:MAG: type II secretion system protein GspE [Deltaproteobacteria bacterium RIFCSPLOWO2_02_FULL_50_16]|nr:MAG: type II secretion system protein GspE [Deltaproteobacteria bacterium RIFCSPHIGHO2_02_FULL_50_15]OGQ57727.1 MAG: type II secretion system protein GspE [Deltaproteobacteria bacterium RIFCSPLOWO2_02_FULL_50_16]